MFNFHKPRVYRSNEGCCICRAKSSSSRFTDASKYELDSMKCFNLTQPRQGEICNACVLLVKRFKRLPADSTRSWGHVVDARAGPGSKPTTTKQATKKQNENKEEKEKKSVRNKSSLTLSERFSKILKKVKKNTSLRKTPNKKNSNSNSNKIRSFCSRSNALQSNAAAAEERMQFIESLQLQLQHSDRRVNTATQQLTASKTSLHGILGSKRRKSFVPKKKYNCGAIESFACADDDDVDVNAESEWRKRKTCCGIIYECKSFGAVRIIDLHTYKVCAKHAKSLSKTTNQSSQSAFSCNSTNLAITPILKKHHLFLNRQTQCVPMRESFATQQLLQNVLNTGEITKVSQLQQNTLTFTNPNMNNSTIRSTACSIQATAATVTKTMLSNKFSDNSSDSGFDENTQERKSASPLLANMFLANGVQVKGQQQNIMLTGNEVAAKMLQKKCKQDKTAVVAAAGAGNMHKPLAEPSYINTETRVSNSIKITRIHCGDSAQQTTEPFLVSQLLKAQNEAAAASTTVRTALMSQNLCLPPTTIINNNNLTITPATTTLRNTNSNCHQINPASIYLNQQQGAPLNILNTNSSSSSSISISSSGSMLKQNFITQVSSANMTQNIIIIKTAAGLHSSPANNSSNNSELALKTAQKRTSAIV